MEKVEKYYEENVIILECGSIVNKHEHLEKAHQSIHKEMWEEDTDKSATKKYWIEKIEYPNADCIPYGECSYDDKEFALQEFEACIDSIDENDKDTCVALYEVEDDYDTRIRIYDNGTIINEE